MLAITKKHTITNPALAAVKKILEDLSDDQKVITLLKTPMSKIANNADIKVKIEELITADKMGGVTVSILRRGRDYVGSTAKPFRIALTKGNWNEVIVDGFSVKRTKIDVEVAADESIVIAKKILDDLDDKVITLFETSTSAITGNADIKAKIEELVTIDKMDGVTVFILGTGNFDLTAKSFRIILTKGEGTVIVKGFSVKRTY